MLAAAAGFSIAKRSADSGCAHYSITRRFHPRNRAKNSSEIKICLRGKALPTRFGSKRKEKEPDRVCNGCQRDRNSQRAKMLHARADEKRDPRSAKTRKGSAKRGRAAFRWVLLRQPERVDGKICSS